MMALGKQRAEERKEEKLKFRAMLKKFKPNTAVISSTTSVKSGIRKGVV